MIIGAPSDNNSSRTPWRTKLSREQCISVLGSVVAGLVQLSDSTTVREALDILHKSDPVWENFRMYEAGGH